jgi:hypothetical protein
LLYRFRRVVLSLLFVDWVPLEEDMVCDFPSIDINF